MKKILLYFLLFYVLCSMFYVSPAFASGWIDKSSQDFAAALDKARGWDCPPPEGTGTVDPNAQVNKEGWAADTLGDMMHTSNMMILGLGATNCEEKQTGFLKNSAVGMTGNLIAAMYANPPASTAYYVYDLLQNAGFVSKAYAQGIGFSGLSPILPLWKAFRNISYIILVVVLIAMGFMIMFRMKIDPQTVISIQNSLPKIVVTLILITFSYAIAGLLIDLMYLAIMIIISILGQGAGYDAARISEVQTDYLTGGLANLFGAVFSGGLRSVEDLVRGFLGDPRIVARLHHGWLLNFPFLIGGIVRGIVQAISSVIFLVLVSFTLLFIFVRLFFTLLASYIQIVLAVIFGPVQILFGTIPGRGGFGAWFRNIVANLVAFPVTAAMLLLGMILAQANYAKALWTPPMLISTVGEGVSGLIALGFIILTPSIVNASKELFAAKPALPISPGMIIAPILGAGQTAAGTFMSMTYLGQFGATIPGIKRLPWVSQFVKEPTQKTTQTES